MSTTEELRRKYVAALPVYDAWGKVVSAHVCGELDLQLGGALAREGFLRIPPQHRTKSIDSLIDKAFRRGKHYTDPFLEITDKVGVRFVVLLLKHIDVVAAIVESADIWKHSLDRDFLAERERNPMTFDYQSRHYVVRTKGDQTHGGIVVPDGTPCEIQIRTLLQHAYSEMAHDTVYKGTGPKNPLILRKVARTMALIETTDDVFTEVSNVLSERSRVVAAFGSVIEEIYADHVGSPPDPAPALTTAIFEAYSDLFPSSSDDAFGQFIGSRPDLVEGIKEQRGNGSLYDFSVVVPIFYLMVHKGPTFRARWFGTPDDIRPLFNDLGIAVD